MRDVSKEDSNLPGIYPPDAIFVDTKTSMVLCLHPSCFQLKEVHMYLPVSFWLILLSNGRCIGALWHKKHFFSGSEEFRWGNILWTVSWEGCMEGAADDLYDWENDRRCWFCILRSSSNMNYQDPNKTMFVIFPMDKAAELSSSVLNLHNQVILQLSYRWVIIRVSYSRTSLHSLLRKMRRFCLLRASY